MILDDYQKADCTLFRLPPIDTSAIEELLTAQLVQAWQQGQNATTALQAVLNNQEAINTVAQQLQENLSFQEATLVNNLNAETAKNSTLYEQEKEQQIASITSANTDEKKAKEEEHYLAAQKAQIRKEHYSVEQQRLDEMRARVQARLERVGGGKGLETLLQIHSAVQTANPLEETKKEKTPAYTSPISDNRGIGYTSKKQTPSPLSYGSPREKSANSDPKYDLPTRSGQREQAQTAALNATSLDAKLSANPTVAEGVDIPTQPNSTELHQKSQAQIEEKNKSRTYRALRKVWDVLNYKIW